MARTTPGETRQRIVDAAVRLFATKGYDATSVADIQVACGLASGSGALYKHFPSKRALLEHAVGRNLATVELAGGSATVALPEDLGAALRALAEVVLGVIEADRDLIRIMLREFDGFSELFERMWDGVVANVYRQGAAWLTAERERGAIEVADPAATSAVLLASLTYYPLLHILIGRTPGDMERDRFLDAWVDHGVRTLRPRA